MAIEIIRLPGAQKKTPHLRSGAGFECLLEPVTQKVNLTLNLKTLGDVSPETSFKNLLLELHLPS